VWNQEVFRQYACNKTDFVQDYALSYKKVPEVFRELVLRGEEDDLNFYAIYILAHLCQAEGQVIRKIDFSKNETTTWAY
jgi:hypothetical protein